MNTSHLYNHWVRKKKEGHRWAALTASDYPTGRLLDSLGLDFILVGDSLGMVTLGYPDTTQVTLEIMAHHTAAVRRGVQHTLVVADLPKDAYETEEMALRNAAALQSAGAQAVKLEGGQAYASIIRALNAQAIPVLAHIGFLPQQINEINPYRKMGKTPEEKERIYADALAVQEAGAFGVILELVIPSLTTELTDQLDIPTIGIGSGENCDGQIIVLSDLAGFTPWFKPKFAPCYGNVAKEIQNSAQRFIQEVRRNQRDLINPPASEENGENES